MFEYSCQICGNDHDQDNTHEGAFVYGGYGSTKYDETKLIWVGPAPAALEKGGHICDSCIDVQLESGTLEAFSAVFDTDAANQMSAKGYAKVFKLGAIEMYRECLEARGSIPAPAGELTQTDVEAIEMLRARITNDPTRAKSYTVTQNPQHGRLARDIGEAHVLAALVLGKIGGDAPDFTEAAETFGQRLAEHEASSRELFEELLSVTSAQVADNETATPS